MDYAIASVFALIMKLMQPLEQFVCDTCGQIIEAPREGWLEWISDPDTGKAHSFRICHHKSYSPIEGDEGCYFHGGKRGRADNHLHNILDVRMAHLLQFVDLGKYHEPNFVGPHVSDLREWTELARRLTIPYYEQARLFWTRAQEDGYFRETNEIVVYSEGFLTELIEKYGDDADL